MLGHAVTIARAVQPRGRSRRRPARARQRAPRTAELIALGPAVPISRRSRMGVPVGVRANLALALARGRFDVVHGFEPGLPSLSYLALRDARGARGRDLLSPERLGYPPGRAQRERLLGAIDALLATSPDDGRRGGASASPATTARLRGSRPELFQPGEKEQLIVLEWRQTERPLLARARSASSRELPDWELVAPADEAAVGAAVRPARRSSTASTCGRARDAREPRRAARRGRDLRACAGRPRRGSRSRPRPRAPPSPRRPGVDEQPELAAAEMARLAEDDAVPRAPRRARRARRAERRPSPPSRDELDELYDEPARPRRAPRRARRRPARRPRLDRRRPAHAHELVARLLDRRRRSSLDHAEAEGLGAIAVTDHNVFGGALEAVELARGRDLVVIPGEEVKTDGQGEVIGLFLQRGDPARHVLRARRSRRSARRAASSTSRTRSTGCTRSRTRRRSTATSPRSTSSRSTTRACSSRATTTRRCASRASTTSIAGAGSDAHVLQGVGTGALRMRAFDGPEEFLLSLRSAEILRRPKSLALPPGPEVGAQAKERVR